MLCGLGIAIMFIAALDLIPQGRITDEAREIIMKVFLSLIALFGLIAITDIALSPSANATTVTSGIHALKTAQTCVAKKAYYRRGYYRGGPPLAWRLLSPWLRLRCPSPLLVALRSSHLPLVTECSQSGIKFTAPGVQFSDAFFSGACVLPG